MSETVWQECENCQEEADAMYICNHVLSKTREVYHECLHADLLCKSCCDRFSQELTDSELEEFFCSNLNVLCKDCWGC